MKKSVKEKAFGLFDKHPNMTVKAMSARYGIAESTLYRYRKQWKEETPVVAEPFPGEKRPKTDVFKKHCARSVQGAFITGVALGALMTIFAYMING